MSENKHAPDAGEEMEKHNLAEEKVDSAAESKGEDGNTEDGNTVDVVLEDETQNNTPVSKEEQLQAELNAVNDRYLRLYAEFDNYKRRTAKERVEMLQTAGKDVIANLLTVLDDFDRALVMMEDAADVNAVKEGVDLINQKFRKILQQQGLKEMEAKGQSFDADFHEAITKIDAAKDMKGKVIDEIEKGYFLNGKVLRYAKVVVGS